MSRLATRSVPWARAILACASAASFSLASALAAAPVSASAATLTGSITVSAASSLTGVFTQLGKRFQSAHRGTSIAFNFASSSTLATQIEQGAPADVFASASMKDMQGAQKAGDIVGSATIFTRNTLAIVVKPGNPLHIHSLANLTTAKVVALCAATAPCGKAARLILAMSKVVIPTSHISLGQDVKSTLAQVTTGDASAAIVYVTDARTVAGQGVAVAIPTSQDVITSYPIGLVKASTHRTLARIWIAYVLGAIGQRALRSAGFLPAH
jgi:molybdate transport system substrate-binding protein